MEATFRDLEIGKLARFFGSTPPAAFIKAKESITQEKLELEDVVADFGSSWVNVISNAKILIHCLCKQRRQSA